MNITNAVYITDDDGKNETIHCDINGVSNWVPIDPANRHYDEIMRQVAAGELTIQDAD